MKKLIADRYELTTCTAAAASIGSTTRQATLYYHDLQDEFRDGDGVIFGYTMDDINTEADIADLGCALSTEADDLNTVEMEE